MEYISTEKDLNSIVPTLLKQLQTKRIWLLSGQMGSGKTTLVKRMGIFLGLKDEVTSPSYSIINEYTSNENLISGKRVYHIDLYRLGHIKDALEIGIEEILEGTDLVIIEWADIIYPLLAKHSFQEIHIELLDNQTRRYILKPNK